MSTLKDGAKMSDSQLDNQSPDDHEKGTPRSDALDGKIHWTFQGVMATVSLCGIWVGSQIPLFFVGGALTYIAESINNTTVIQWIPVAYTLVIAAVAPFSGYMADLLGRRYVTLLGSVFLIVGIIVTGTAHSFSQACAGMSVVGCGAAICELTALSGISELVPVRKRGYYLAICTSFLIPFTPYVMYSQLLSTRATWRWTMWICLIYVGLCTAGILAFYFPERQVHGDRASAKSILARIDYPGAVLSITGATLFLVALSAGGYTHPWASAYVLCTLLIGVALIAAFCIWEWRYASNPMVPAGVFAGNRIVKMAFLVAFVGGMNLYSLLNFFPITFTDVFNPDPVQVGLKGLGYGISVTAGATIFNGLLSVFRHHNRELLVTACIMMTAFGGALSSVTPETPRTAVAFGTIAGFGVGGVYVPAATIAITASEDSLIATTAALSLAIRTLGGSIGYAIYYNVFAEKLKVFLPIQLATYAEQAGLPQSSLMSFVEAYATAPMSAASVPGVTPAVLQAAAVGAQWAYSQALAYVWYVSIAFGCCSILASAFLGDVSPYMTNRVAAVNRR